MAQRVEVLVLKGGQVDQLCADVLAPVLNCVTAAVHGDLVTTLDNPPRKMLDRRLDAAVARRNPA